MLFVWQQVEHVDQLIAGRAVTRDNLTAEDRLRIKWVAAGYRHAISASMTVSKIQKDHKDIHDPNTKAELEAVTPSLLASVIDKMLEQEHSK